MAFNHFTGLRGIVGRLVNSTDPQGNLQRGIIPAVVLASDTDNPTAFGSSTNPMSVSQNQPLPAGTDRSGSITAGGTAQDIAPANTARQGLTVQNTSDTPMRVTESGTDATGATGYLLAAGAALNVSTNKRISIFCATSGKTFAATEY